MRIRVKISAFWIYKKIRFFMQIAANNWYDKTTEILEPEAGNLLVLVANNWELYFFLKINKIYTCLTYLHGVIRSFVLIAKHDGLCFSDEIYPFIRSSIYRWSQPEFVSILKLRHHVKSPPYLLNIIVNKTTQCKTRLNCLRCIYI